MYLCVCVCVSLSVSLLSFCVVCPLFELSEELSRSSDITGCDGSCQERCSVTSTLRIEECPKAMTPKPLDRRQLHFQHYPTFATPWDFEVPNAQTSRSRLSRRVEAQAQKNVFSSLIQFVSLPGHPPAKPPGCCTKHCHCMDGTKRPISFFGASSGIDRSTLWVWSVQGSQTTVPQLRNMLRRP